MPYAGCDPGLAGLVGAIAWEHAQNPTRRHRGRRHGRTIPRTQRFAEKRASGSRLCRVVSLALSPRSKRAQPRLGTIALVLVSAWARYRKGDIPVTRIRGPGTASSPRRRCVGTDSAYAVAARQASA